jgi:hypothetical protein
MLGAEEAPTILTSLTFDNAFSRKLHDDPRDSLAALWAADCVRRGRRFTLEHTTKEWRMSQDTKKPANLRANAMPTDGYVLSVDGKLKTRYETSKEALAAGSKLKQSFPVLQVAIYDATERVYTPLDLQEK